MTIDSFQDTLFEDPIGLRFRHAREKAKLSMEFVAQQLRLPVAVLDAIEREDWPRLGAPIFVRSYVGSYAKILGLPADLADEVVRGKPAPQLIAIGGSSPARRVFDRGLMNLAYLAMTVVIVGSVVMLAMYFQAPRRSAEVLPLDPPSSYSDTQDAGEMVFAASQPMLSEAGGVSTIAAATPTMDPALVASPSSSPATPSAPGGNDIVLRFRGESWVDIVDRAGAHVERGLVAAGAERRFAAGQLAQVTLGDAAAVDVSMADAALDLAPYRDANVARFTVSSEGKIIAAAGN